METVPIPGLTPETTRQLWNQAKKNAETLRACPRHLFDVDPPYQMGQKFQCANCGGLMDSLAAFAYILGYKASGANPNDIMAGFEPDYKADPDYMTQEEVGEMAYRFSCILEHATGGKMSKTNYTLEAMRGVVDDHITDCVEKAVEEQIGKDRG